MNQKKGVGTRRLFNFLFLAAYAARDCFAAESHSTTTQYHRLRRLAQCRKEKKWVQRSSLKSTASSNLKHSEVKRFEKRCIWFIYEKEFVIEQEQARLELEIERECLIWNYPESSLWTGNLVPRAFPLKKGGAGTNPFFKGKALGTRLVNRLSESTRPWLQWSIFKISGIK